jgi:hypothetical protein
MGAISSKWNILILTFVPAIYRFTVAIIITNFIHIRAIVCNSLHAMHNFYTSEEHRFEFSFHISFLMFIQDGNY